MKNELALTRVQLAEDKVKLAEELGLGYHALGVISRKAQEVIDEVKAGDEVKRLTDLNFKPVTMKEIEEILSVWYYEPSEAFSNFVAASFLSAISVGIIGLCCMAFSVGSFDLAGRAWTTLEVICLITAAISGRTNAEIKELPLTEWKGNIPYGALLAVKEAKKKGLTNFHIYYPAKKAVPMAADPIIVAKGRHGVMVNIFAWDDSKIYDA